MVQIISRGWAADQARQNPAAWIAYWFERELSRAHRRSVAHALRHQHWAMEVHRGLGKTVQGSLLMAWHGGNDPNLRQAIIGSNNEEADKTNAFLKDIINSPKFRGVFPHVRIRRDRDRVRSFTLSRTGSLRDASFESHSVFGRPGGRKDRMWFDDVCDLRNSILQPTMREQVKQAVKETWMPMLDYGGKPHETLSSWATFTPWHTDDMGRDWREQHSAAGTLLRMPCDGFRSPWPEQFTEEALRSQYNMMGPIGYARAYELVPLSSDLLVFQPQWLRGAMWTRLPGPPDTCIAAIDFAYSLPTADKPNPDYSVMLIARISAGGDVFVTDMLRVRKDFPSFAEEALALAGARGVNLILAEGGGPQRGIVDSFQRASRIPVLTLDRRGADKMVRGVAVQAFVRAGKFHLPCGADGDLRVDMNPVFEEMVAFPAAEHDDCYDAAVDLCTAAQSGRAAVLRPAPTVVPGQRGGIQGHAPSAIDQGAWD